MFGRDALELYREVLALRCLGNIDHEDRGIIAAGAYKFRGPYLGSGTDLHADPAAKQAQECEFISFSPFPDLRLLPFGGGTEKQALLL